MNDDVREMEWPRFENGEHVLPGNWLQDDNGEPFEAVSFTFTYDWWEIDGYGPDGSERKLTGMAYGSPAKRPLAYDGDWRVESIQCVNEPAVAADGKPLNVGQEVWDIYGRRRFRILDVKKGAYCIKTVGIDYMGLERWSRPCDLTHERPDSWERLEHEAVEVADEISHKFDNDDWQWARDKVKGLVRRCKTLAEREVAG